MSVHLLIERHFLWHIDTSLRGRLGFWKALKIVLTDVQSQQKLLQNYVIDWAQGCHRGKQYIRCTFLWVVTSVGTYSLVHSYQRFGRIFCLIPQVRRMSVEENLYDLQEKARLDIILKTEAVIPIEMLITIYQTIQSQNREDRNIYSYYHEDFESNVMIT